MRKKAKTRENTPEEYKKSAEAILEQLSAKSHEAAVRFIGSIGEDIIAIPKIRGKSQEEADEKANKHLDNMLAKFLDAQSAAFNLWRAAEIYQDTFHPLDN